MEEKHALIFSGASIDNSAFKPGKLLHLGHQGNPVLCSNIKLMVGWPKRNVYVEMVQMKFYTRGFVLSKQKCDCYGLCNEISKISIKAKTALLL